MANKLKITQTNSVSNTTVDAHVSSTQINGGYIGGTGGLTSQDGSQIQAQVYVTGGSSTTGSILRQKGMHKFRVTDGTNEGTCTLVNSPNLSSGQMNVLVTLNGTDANIAAANVAGGATSTYITYDTRSSVTGPVVTPRVGDYIIGATGTVAVAQVTAVNSASNVTVATTGNVLGQTGVTITTNTYAKKITNRFVSDFNDAKFRYHLDTQDATFVKVQNA